MQKQQASLLHVDNAKSCIAGLMPSFLNDSQPCLFLRLITFQTIYTEALTTQRMLNITIACVFNGLTLFNMWKMVLPASRIYTPKAPLPVKHKR